MQYILLALFFFFPSIVSSQDRITTYTNEQGQTVYTNEKAPPVSPPLKTQPPKLLTPELEQSLQRIPKQHNSFVPPFPIDFADPQTQKQIRADADEAKAFTGLIVILIIAVFVFWLLCLIDILKNEFAGSNKTVWFLTVTLLPLIGPLLYYFIGEHQKIIPEDL